MKLALLLFLIVLPTQIDRPQNKERVSLDLGTVTVWLGMPKTEVVKRCTDAGFEIVDLGEGVIAHIADRTVHDLRFKNGRLSYADLEWYNSNVEEIDAVIGALGALADKRESQTCTILHQPYSAPDIVLNRVFITCGDRSVFIASGKSNGKPTLDVSERIGEIPPAAEK
jgi:hypothetical protein